MVWWLGCTAFHGHQKHEGQIRGTHSTGAEIIRIVLELAMHATLLFVGMGCALLFGGGLSRPNCVLIWHVDAWSEGLGGRVH